MLATLLHIMSKEDFDVILKFLEKNRDAPISVIQPVSDLLSLIIRKADIGAFETILKYDIDVDAFTTAGSTPLIIASYYSSPYFVEKLLQKGAKVSVCEKTGDSALSSCLTTPLTDTKIKCAKLLIHAGSDIERFNNLNDNRTYHIALLLKEIIALEKTPEPESVGCHTESIHDDYVLIRAIKTNPDMKTQRKIICNHGWIKLINDSNSIKKIFKLSPKMMIELPIPSEKIIGHILPVGTIVNDDPITESVSCRFFNPIITKDVMRGGVESFVPSSIYY